MVCEFNCSPDFHERLVAPVYLRSRSIQSLVFVPLHSLLEQRLLVELPRCPLSKAKFLVSRLSNLQVMNQIFGSARLWRCLGFDVYCNLWKSCGVYLFINVWYHSISFSCLFFFFITVSQWFHLYFWEENAVSLWRECQNSTQRIVAWSTWRSRLSKSVLRKGAIFWTLKAR